MAISDYSVTGNKKRSQLDSRRKGFSDLDLRLTLHPIKKDIIPLRDDAAIKNALKNLILPYMYL